MREEGHKTTWVEMLKRVVTNLTKKGLLRWPGEEQEDLKILKTRPSARMYAGIGLICLSYLTCWPLIGVLGWLAFKLQEPLILTIGSPAAYVSSHCLFLVGAFVAGSEGVGYVRALVGWIAQTTFLRLTKASLQPAGDSEPDKRTAAIKEGE